MKVVATSLALVSEEIDEAMKVSHVGPRTKLKRGKFQNRTKSHEKRFYF